MDVQRRDAAEQLIGKPMDQVEEAFSLLWVGPCFPYGAQLHYDIHRGEHKLGQGEQSLKQGPGFGLRSNRHSCYGALPDKCSQGEGVYTEAEHPGLSPFVIGGGCGI